MITENKKRAWGCKEDKKEAPLRTQDGVKQVNACTLLYVLHHVI